MHASSDRYFLAEERFTLMPLSTEHEIGSALKRVFDRVYIINLVERTDRRREIEAQMRLVGLEVDDDFIRLFPLSGLPKKIAGHPLARVAAT